MDLILGLPKKDYLDEVLEKSVELGIRKILCFRSDYSQKQKIKDERVDRILINALKQSNNPYLPEIVFVERLLDDALEKYSTCYLFSLDNHEGFADSLGVNEDVALIIGPEGGFSEEEERNFLGKPNVSAVHLPTSILRTPTAVVAAAGAVTSRVKC